MVIEPVAGGGVEPGFARPVERLDPAAAGFAQLRKRRHDRLWDRRRRGTAHRRRVRRPGGASFLSLFIRPKHQHVDARHHARNRLVGDLRKDLFAELKEHQVRAVAEHQELEMVMPHLGEALDAAMERHAYVVILRDTLGLQYHGLILEIGQLGHLNRIDLGDQSAQAPFPFAVQLGPVFVVVRRALLEYLEAALHFLGVGDRMRRDVDAAVHDPMFDAERGGKSEHARRIGAETV